MTPDKIIKCQVWKKKTRWLLRNTEIDFMSKRFKVRIPDKYRGLRENVMFFCHDS